MNVVNDGLELSQITPPTAGQGELFSQEETRRQQIAETFRTRLNAIVGFAELLGLESLSPNARNDLKHLLKAARDLLGVVNQQFGGARTANGDFNAVTERPEQTCDLLYIEDDFANVALVERILELRPSMTFKHAALGTVGIEMAKAEKPKLVLLDLNLPDIHGADVLQALQSCPETSSIPVVVLSANAIGTQIERLLASGARNYLTKPFELDQFLAVIDEWMQASTRAR